MSFDSAPVKSSPKPKRLLQNEDLDDDEDGVKQANSSLIRSNPNADKSFEDLSNALRSENANVTVHPKIKGSLTNSTPLTSSTTSSNSRNSQSSLSNSSTTIISSPASPTSPRHSKFGDQELTDREFAIKIQKEEEEERKKERESFKLTVKSHQDSLASKDWYFGKLDRESSEAILLACKEDTFLVRDSSIPFHYAISLFTFKEQNIQHSLIVPLDYGQRYYQLQSTARMYSSVEELVTKAPELKGYQPVKNAAKRLSVNLNSSINNNNINNINKDSLQKPPIDSDVKREDSPNSVSFENEISQATQEAKKILEENSNSSVAKISKIKDTIKLIILQLDIKIQEYDKILVAKSIELGEEVKLPDSENAIYLNYMQGIATMRDLLTKLRLKGDEFRVMHKKEAKLLKINQEGQIMFCNVKRTADPKDLIPPDDMSSYVYFNIGVVEGTSNVINVKKPENEKKHTLYEITSAKLLHFIDELVKVAPDSSRGGVCIYWKNNKKSSFTTVIAEESTELIEVIGCHLKKFKQSTIKQIQLLKDIWNCKSTKFDADAAEHQMLLLRLWSALMVGSGSSLGSKGDVPLIGEHWKILGFQGTNPATDFRGMGLLGLLNLIYFAEKYSERANKILRNKREYPFAVTGINITSTLLNMLNLTNELVNQPPAVSDWHTPLLTLFYYADNEDTFDELYSQSFLLFDKLWEHSNAKYMDFPNVIKTLQQRIEELLVRKPLDVKQLIAWIEQLQVAYSSSSTSTANNNNVVVVSGYRVQ